MIRRDERGAATLLALAVAGLLLVVGSALAVAAALLADHRRAQAAADLAALAGAAGQARGSDGCREAARVALANGARLTSCLVSGREVQVTVSVAGPRWHGLRADLEGEARAGPR